MPYEHTPVMLAEVLAYLDPKPGGIFFDGTLGGGSYAREIASRVGPTGLVLATDLDRLAIENAEKWPKLNKNLKIKIKNDNFNALYKILREEWPKKSISFDGVVLDLGLSSAQLADPDRGFSFKLDAPLNMAFGSGTRSTEVIVNKYSQDKLYRIIKDLGEERFAMNIARSIVDYRHHKKITSTVDLLECISRAVPERFKKNSKIHFATKTFQALRMETNRELESLTEFLPQALEHLKPGGRMAIVSFHSLEDRIVKNFFKTESRDCICPSEQPLCSCNHHAKIKIITKKPIKAATAEVGKNPRSRSAILRVGEKI